MCGALKYKQPYLSDFLNAYCRGKPFLSHFERFMMILAGLESRRLSIVSFVLIFVLSLLFSGVCQWLSISLCLEYPIGISLFLLQYVLIHAMHVLRIWSHFFICLTLLSSHRELKPLCPSIYYYFIIFNNVNYTSIMGLKKSLLQGVATVYRD